MRRYITPFRGTRYVDQSTWYLVVQHSIRLKISNPIKLIWDDIILTQYLPHTFCFTNNINHFYNNEFKHKSIYIVPIFNQNQLLSSDDQRHT